MTRIDRFFARTVGLPMAAPQPGTARRSDEASHKVSTDQSWHKKFEGIYASLLKSDFGKHLPTFGESAEQIEKRHGASLIRKLNAQSLVLQDGSKKPLGDLVLERLGVTDPNEFRLNAKTKAQIESMDLRQVAADSYLKNCLPNYGRYQLKLPRSCHTPALTRNEQILVRNCCRYAAAAGETENDAFELANWNLRQIRKIAAESNLSDSGRDALVNLLNRNGDLVKERINPEAPSFTTRIQYGLYLAVKQTTDDLVRRFKENESWQHFTPDQRFDLPPHLIRA
jgi:hypothetical protein